jgi:hypothetical protein
MQRLCLGCYRTYRGDRCVCTISSGQSANLIGAPILYAIAYVLALRIESVYSGLLETRIAFLRLFGWVPAAVATLNIVVGSRSGFNSLFGEHHAPKAR